MRHLVASHPLISPHSVRRRVHGCPGASGGQVLAVQDAQGLLQGLDLSLAPIHAVLVADASIHAGRLKLVVVRQCRIKLLLRAIQVRLLGSERLRLVLLLGLFVLDVLLLGRLVDLRVSLELIVELLRRGLRCGGLGFEARKVGLDDLKHTEDASILCLQAFVGGVEDRRRLWLLLHQCSRLASFRVKLLEDSEGLRDRRLRLLGVLDRLGVGGLLLLPLLRRLCHGLVEVGNRL
mmetsp:Transcript_21980/g.60066  ORF Transcript_21980/g.60066 Transcript_21980/m.60066 type:complete len:235 (-) Transcript_21980:52-756(-)